MHTLTTKEGRLYAGDHLVIKGWESFNGWYWFATEINSPDDAFGLVQGQETEWGYFNPLEIEAHPMCWPIKRQDLPHAGRRGTHG